VIALVFAILLWTDQVIPNANITPRIQITSELPHLDELHPVTGPERLPFEESRPAWPWFAIGSIALLAIIWWLRRRTTSTTEPNPEEWARRQLAQLGSMNGDCYQLADELSATIRGYLRRKYQVHVEGRTTRELSDDLGEAGLGDLQLREWQNLLNRCDLAKFARAAFTSSEMAEAIRRAQSLLPATLPVSESPSPAETGKLR
jgi:hypothetical protein